MKYPREEQETIIRKDALEDEWHIYTSDAILMAKFDKLTESSPEWRCVNVITCQGDICAKDYRCSGNLVSFRSKTKTLTDAQKKTLAEHAFKPQK